MKSFYLFLFVLLFALSTQAQSPQKYNYQAIARDASGNLMPNTQVGLRITIRQTTATGTAVYQETHLPTTNQFGLFSLEIGTGTVISGTFSTIAWGSNPYFQQVELDPNGTTGGLTYTNMGATQLISVPYALYAGAVAGGGSGWGLTGNAGTNPSTNFVGTTDNQPLKFRINNQNAGQISTNNTALGNNSLHNNTTGYSNVAIGARALYQNTNRSNLVAIGDSALYNNGLGATLLGHSARNTAVGSKALYSNTIGAGNTATGSYALYSNTQGYENTANGFSALYSNTIGAGNTAIGRAALATNTIGYANTANGSYALFGNTEGYSNTANGHYTLQANTTGAYNTANGIEALRSNTTGQENAANGGNALYSNTTGSNNTANGVNSLFYNTTGYSNTAIGHSALFRNTTHSNLVAIGDSALYNNGVGATLPEHSIQNTAIGSKALYSNTTGYYNTANGASALPSNTTGYYNTAIGAATLSGNITGGYNTVVGAAADVSTSNLSNASAFGYNAITNASNKIVIGHTLTTTIGGYANWSNLSDGRFKNNVAENVPGLSFINNLRPVTYTVDLAKLQRHITAQMPDSIARRYYPNAEEIAKANAEIRTGFIAQEVEQTAKKLGYNFDGVNPPQNPTDNYSIEYAGFVPSLVKAVQEQQAIITKQQITIETLQQQNANFQQQIDELKLLINKK